MSMDSMLRIRELLMRLFRQGGSQGPGEEPFSGVRVPRGSSPRGRAAAAAVMEPEPDVLVAAVGRVRQDRRP
jgi:hypothetical protein